MKHLIAIGTIFAFLTLPVMAQDQTEEETAEAEVEITAEEIAAAAEIISEISEDQAKADGYCAIIKEMEATPEDDEAKADDLANRMDEYLTGLGEGIADAFAIGDGFDPEAEEAASLNEALAELDEKCGINES